MEVVAGVLGALGAFGIMKGIIIALFSGKEDDEIKKLNKQIDDLNQKKNQYQKKEQKSQEKIDNLEKLLEKTKEEQKKKELERERELLQKQQEERQKIMQQIEEEKKMFQECKEAIDNEFTKGLLKILSNFSEEEEKWINTLDSPEITKKINKLKENLDELFDKLFESENVKKKIKDKFLEIVKSNVNHKELEKMNFIVIGASGVGKSTLINELFGEKLAIEGNGKRTTTENKKYESKLVPFMSILDTVGAEINTGHKLSDVLKDTLEEIMKKLENNNPNDHIHCIIYCTSSNRFFEDELDVILNIRKKYDGNKLPIVIVYTKAIDDEDVNSSKKTINEFLEKHGEHLSDDIFGITFIKVNSRSMEKSNNMGGKLYYPSFGLKTLMQTCFEKGEHSYRFAIKKSLIEIGKRTIKEYLVMMQSQIENNLNYFYYLSMRFEPNFPEYIAFCFQKITDIFKQEGITENDLNKLDNYLSKFNINSQEGLTSIKCMICDNSPKNPYECQFCNSEVCETCFLNKKENEGYYRCKNCEQENFIKKENSSYGDSNKMDTQPMSSNSSYGLNEDFGKKKLSKQLCMICKNNPKDPYKCKNCGYQICEECLLKQYEYVEKFNCQNCGENDFEKMEEEENKINEIENENEKEEKDKDEDNQINEKEYSKEDNIISETDFNEEKFKKEYEEEENYLQILNSNLNLESKEEINKFIEIFKKELIEVSNKRFDEFAQKSAEAIFMKIFEKYSEYILQNKKVEKLDKNQLKSQITEALNLSLKENAIKNFLSKIASQFYQEIASKIGNKCEEKLNAFVEELAKDEEANEFFKNFDELKGNKLKFEKELKEYFDKLDEKESKSIEQSFSGIESKGESNENYGYSSSEQNFSSSSQF